MKNIFLQDATFGEDTPPIDVPREESQWNFFLEQELLSRFPSLYGRSIFIDVKRAEGGNGHGAIVVKLNTRQDETEEGEEQLVFPFIIQEFKMFPLDVFEYKDRFRKATEENIQEVLSSEAIDFAVPHERSDRELNSSDNLVGASQMEILNPTNVFSGKTVMASEDFKTVEKIAEVKQYLSLIEKGIAENPNRLAKYAGAHRAFARFIKVAQDFVSNPSFKLHYLTKAARLRYDEERCKYNFDYTYLDTVDNKIKLASEKAETLKEIVNKIAQVTDADPLVEKIRSDNEAVDAEAIDREAQVLSLSESTESKLNPNTSYVLYSSEGRPYTGTVIPSVVDFDLHLLPTQLFIGTEPVGTYAYAENLDVKDIPGNSPDWNNLTVPVEQGQTVSFLIPRPDNNIPAAATFPFKILSVKSVEGDVAYVGQFLMRQGIATLIPTDTVKTPVKLSGTDIGYYDKLVKPGDLAYLVPKSLKAIPLDSAINTVSIKEGEMRFISRQALEDRAKIATIIPRGDSYVVEHPDIDISDGKLALASLGAIHLDPTITKALSKKAQKLTVLLPNYRGHRFKTAATAVGKPLFDKDILIKTAAGIDDESLSYLTLALGLIDTKSGFKFEEFINDFSETVNQLIKLLLSARLGMPMGDSASLKLGIDALDSTIRQLKSL